ncbi:MAG: hypothetical protein AAF960_12895 [Bacteroidota bacterium]
MNIQLEGSIQLFPLRPYHPIPLSLYSLINFSFGQRIPCLMLTWTADLDIDLSDIFYFSKATSTSLPFCLSASLPYHPIPLTTFHLDNGYLA